ncbi:MAG: FHA domain-containing protein, partial [Planctomycetes bacterium]|nr:FHA domain-containing protein [Planctomycetota bacterium]
KPREAKTPPAKQRSTIAVNMGAEAEPSNDASVLATLSPRLVFDDEKLRGTVAIINTEFSIGRKRSTVDNDVDCALDHPTISMKHAVVKLAQRHFFLEDRGSKNGTFIDGRPIPIMASRELRPDCVVRFGVVDALFVVDRDSELRPLTRNALYDDAADYLVRKGLLKPKDRAAAAKTGGNVGEELVATGACTVAQWSQALRAIDSAGVVSGRRRGVPTLWMALSVLVLIALAVTLLALLRPELFGN